MMCPHCRQHFHAEPEVVDVGKDRDFTSFEVNFVTCPACHRLILRLVKTPIVVTQIGRIRGTPVESLFHPGFVPRRELGPEVPSEYSGEYVEASALLAVSPKASAAISRRLLQRMLRDVLKVKPGELSKEIDEALAGGTLPSDIAKNLDAIRNVGNFATHPIKNTSTGEVVEVEPGEAEWTIELIEDLFDLWFTRPAVQEKRREALNKKLAESGKPPLKKG
jgi:hypothetical protein